MIDLTFSLGKDFPHSSLSTSSELMFPSSYESNRIAEVVLLRVTVTQKDDRIVERNIWHNTHENISICTASIR